MKAASLCHWQAFQGEGPPSSKFTQLHHSSIALQQTCHVKRHAHSFFRHVRLVAIVGVHTPKKIKSGKHPTQKEDGFLKKVKEINLVLKIS
jgi:hypothetical protein